MNIEFLRQYCLKKTGVTESFPFDSETLVFKVGGKAFLLTGVESFAGINVKCDPERAVDLRERHAAVQPGYHMNKKHWNTLVLDGSLADAFILGEVDHSYALVFDGLTRKIKSELGING